MSLESQVGDLVTATTSLLSAVNTSKVTLDGSTAASAASATLASQWATKTDGAVANGEFSAKKHAVDAGASASAAADYASQAQATNPDSPIRLNPRIVSADFSVPSAYNAASVGPIAISEGVTVTIGDNATWSIH